VPGSDDVVHLIAESGLLLHARSISLDIKSVIP
jgi:hypothetical protein